ncbi:class I SAM-dependent methyltransferase [Lentzea sp. NPDC058436]|uniref:class I SAM-dependent methyltransferase n=1 Tax=Lentzea sp. NPDC058436 TaxID=3346499 RepID=UPI003668ACF1
MSTSRPPLGTDAAAFWQSLYASRPSTDPTPNVRLTEIASALPPGDALDLGSGAGGDALWLAGRGWHVTAADISAAAVEGLTSLAASHGVGDRISAVRYDLGSGFPPGEFDLVCAHYLHTPFELDRTAVLRSAAHALRVNGRLLVVDHGSAAPWSWDQGAHHPSPREIAGSIGLDPARWTVERADAPRRTATGPDGQQAEVVDHVLLVHRTA